MALGHSERESIVVSRLAIEAAIRRLALTLANVATWTQVDVREPTLDLTGRRVDGERLRRGDGGEETLSADLGIDCTSRGSRTSAWLRRDGFEGRHEERVTVGI